MLPAVPIAPHFGAGKLAMTRFIIIMLLALCLAACPAGAGMWYIPIAERVVGGFDHIQLSMAYPYHFADEAMIAFSGSPAGEQWSQTYINNDSTLVAADGPNLGTADLFFSIVLAGDRQFDRPTFHFQAYRDGRMVDNADFICFGPGEMDWMVTYGTWQVRRVMPPLLMGDANYDGFVDDDDLSLLLANWKGGDMGWGRGDFNASQDVDDDDLSLLLANWTGSPPVVPEPATAGLLVLGAAAILRRKQR